MNEVVLSVQFEHQVIDEVVALTKFREALGEEFPDLEKQPPLPPVREDFTHPPQAGMQFEFLQGPPAVRYWFVSADGSSLIQVQGDRFVLNWRRVHSDQEYPRYRNLRPQFERYFEKFLSALSEEGARVAIPNWCEVTYINHVEAEGPTPGTHGPLSRVLRALNPARTSETLPPVEDTQLQQRFRITREGEDEPAGRLYVTATPAFRTVDNAPIYVISLIARGKPTPPSTHGVLPFFDLGRGLIVRGFKEATTDEMHREWGLAR